MFKKEILVGKIETKEIVLKWSKKRKGGGLESHETYMYIDLYMLCAF